MRAAALGQRVHRPPDVRDPLAAEYQHHLVVRVAVIGRPPRRDLANELRGHLAIEARAEQDAELPVTSGLDLALSEIATQRRGMLLCLACGASLAAAGRG